MAQADEFFMTNIKSFHSLDVSLACLSLHNWLYNQAFYFILFLHSFFMKAQQQQTFFLSSFFSCWLCCVELTITKDINIEKFPSLSHSSCQQLTTNYNFMCAHIHTYTQSHVYSRIYNIQQLCIVRLIFSGLVTSLLGVSHFLTRQVELPFRLLILIFCSAIWVIFFCNLSVDGRWVIKNKNKNLI